MVKGSWIALGVLAAVALVVLGAVGSAVGAYNGLVRESEEVDKQRSVVGVMYDRAFELVPNLVELAERYMANESDVQTRVAALRSGLPAAQGGSVEEQDAYVDQLRQTMLLVTGRVEDYPELRSSELFRDTMDELTNSVNKVAAEKVRYNDRAAAYNAHRRECCMPVLVAGLLGFEAKPYIGARDEARTLEDLRI